MAPSVERNENTKQAGMGFRPGRTAFRPVRRADFRLVRYFRQNHVHGKWLAKRLAISHLSEISDQHTNLDQHQTSCTRMWHAFTLAVISLSRLW